MFSLVLQEVDVYGCGFGVFLFVCGVFVCFVGVFYSVEFPWQRGRFPGQDFFKVSGALFLTHT